MHLSKYWAEQRRFSEVKVLNVFFKEHFCIHPIIFEGQICYFYKVCIQKTFYNTLGEAVIQNTSSGL